jgi:hypothetical protein
VIGGVDSGEARAYDEHVEMFEASRGLRGQGRTLGRRGDIGHPSYLALEMDIVKSIVRYCL